MSRDLEVNNESTCCWEEISSHIIFVVLASVRVNHPCLKCPKLMSSSTSCVMPRYLKVMQLQKESLKNIRLAAI